MRWLIWYLAFLAVLAGACTWADIYYHDRGFIPATIGAFIVLAAVSVLIYRRNRK